MGYSMYSAAILAGGHARRFGGRDKSALLVGGRAILDRQIAELSSVTNDVLVIRRDDDLVPGCGPLGGLHAALTAARGDALFVVACDMPYVTGPFAAYLFSLAGDADIVVPRTERGYHPLCAVYTRACLTAVARRLAERRLRMLDLLDEMRTREVTAEEIERFGDRERLLANVNTPAEYAGLEALQGHKP
jgi:molybdopterin-guanine dinucleotide biosynthesis protein A